MGATHRLAATTAASTVEDLPLSSTIAIHGKSRQVRPEALASSPIKISPDTLERMTDVFKLLADPSRLKIVLALSQDGELHVKALCDLLGQSQPAVSHHLTLMRMAKLVGVRRVGKFSYYRLASDHIRDLLERFFADAGNNGKQIQFNDFFLTYRTR
jgi:ArsR family transcriptional regulator